MYPIYFKDNTCIKCGSNNVTTLDTNDNPIINNSKAIRKVMCTKCKAKYILKWEDENNYYPIDRYNIEKFKENFNN